MTATVFDVDRGLLSQNAHLVAREQFYPEFFDNFLGVTEGVDRFMSYPAASDSEKRKRLDLNHAIDSELRVESDQLQSPTRFTIQERFLRDSKQHFQHLTVTEMNHSSGAESELGKIKSDLFVFGYFDEQDASLIQTAVVDTSLLKRAIVSEDIEFKRQSNRKNQSFLTIPIESIKESSIPSYHTEKDTVTHNTF